MHAKPKHERSEGCSGRGTHWHGQWLKQKPLLGCLATLQRREVRATCIAYTVGH